MAVLVKVFLSVPLGFSLIVAMLFWLAAGVALLAAVAHAAPLLRSCTCTIISTADSGAGTLRGCLSHAGPSEYICFDPSVFPPAAPATITVSSKLPYIIANGLTIDASSASGDRDDYCCIEVTTLDQIAVRLTNIPSNVDYYLYLYLGNTAVATSTNPGNADEEIVYPPQQTGRYCIRVYPYYGYSLRPYTLQADFR